MNKALFIPNGNWMENEMKDAPRADGFEFGLWHAPVLNKGDQPYVMTSVEQFSIPAAAKNPSWRRNSSASSTQRIPSSCLRKSPAASTR